MRFFFLVTLVLVIFALSGYASAARSKSTGLYTAMKPIIKNKDKQRMKKLVEAGRLRWGSGMTMEQKVAFADLLTGKGMSSRDASDGVYEIKYKALGCPQSQYCMPFCPCP
jgi:hypothetical protein